MMMNEKYRNLWERIERFELDDPQVSVTFSDKLRQEQPWSKAFTHQAITEYKRFMFLCVVLPQGASPSKIVDEVWHLHLTYTKSYWIDFCRDTLGQDVHHIPSTGGKEQQQKHQDWYADTLQWYAQYFGIQAPAQIWPSAVKVTYAAPKVSSKSQLILYFGSLGIPWLIGMVFYGQWNIFAMAGSQFLGFYVYAALGALILHNWYRNRLTKLRQQYLEPRIPQDLNAYQMAYLLNGRKSAINAAIINLVDWGKLVVHERKSYIVQKDPLNPSDEYRNNPVLDLLRMNKEGDEVMHWKLDKDLRYGYNVGAEVYSMAKLKLDFNAYVPCLWMILLGVLRCIQGVYNDKPITYLIQEMILLSLIFWGLTYLKDLSFKDWFKDLVKAKYEQQWKTDWTLSQKYSLFGERILSTLPVVFLVAKQFMETPATGSGDGSGGGSCGSSDGGDGGGSSCGGGCGGCGGGGD